MRYAEGVPITNALASLAVRDLSNAAAWYETLLGPGTQPMPEVMEWKLEQGGGLQVYLAPERAGRGTCTMVVDDVDEMSRTLRESGLAPDAEAVHGDRVDTVMVKDPDGNSIAFAAAKDGSFVR